MIKWTGLDGGEFELTVLGYQFPATEEGWDANWLTVSVSVASPRSSWKASSSCIVAWELLSLIYWLDDLQTDEAETWCGLEIEFLLRSLGWSRGRAVVAIALYESLCDPAAGDSQRPARDIVVMAPSALEIT